MDGTVAITDHGWYEFLYSRQSESTSAGKRGLEEVNFWRPSAHWGFRGLPGSPFFFKLRAKYNHAVCGFGFFSKFVRLPDWMAWDFFQENNGSPTLNSLRTKIYGIRKGIVYRSEGPLEQIGCILISQPIFFKPEEWIKGPSDWPAPNLVPMKYSLLSGEGQRIWNECQARMHDLTDHGEYKKAEILVPQGERFGTPTLIAPRLGQGTFRASVLEAYSRACAATHEHSLPALEAAHIKPYEEQGPHEIRNGILLRADVHKLFDRGYITVAKDYRIEVSPRLKQDFDNGKSYYPLHGFKIDLPVLLDDAPGQEYLIWHNENRYKVA